MTPTATRMLMACAVWMTIYGMWCFHFAEGEEENAYFITFPQRIDDGRRDKRDLSTAELDGHTDDASFQLKAFDKDWTLDIKRKKDLISPSFAVRIFAEDGTEIVKREIPDHCHYQGTLRGLKDSTVVLNTCEGLRGIIDDGDNTYHIHPETGYGDKRAHRVFQVKEDPANSIHKNCGNNDEPSNVGSNWKQSGTFSRLRRSISNMDEFYKPYLTTDDTRYNELMLVCDHGMYLKHDKNTSLITDRVVTLVNAVDAIYQRINIRIVIKFVEIWTDKDRMQRMSKGGPDLSKFKDYRNAELVDKFPHDNAHLLSDWSWTDVAGMAYVTGMCKTSSAGVNHWDYGSVIGPYVVLAHEMGHNFGFSHDSGSCKCLTPRGCIMGGHKTRVPGFSDCSMNSLKKIDDACLYNVPTYKSLNGYCGNGIREEGEECDCGTPEICMAKDPCCEPHNCKLRRGAQCSDLHHTCCDKCVFKKQGSLCRALKTDCDVPEYCMGDRGDCPTDDYIRNGYPCNRTNTVIPGTTNFYSVTTRGLEPRITARYVRINPQYWKGWPCLRTEFLGCSPNEVSETAPTPLVSYNNLCLTPKDNTCSPADNTPIVYGKGGLCSESHLQFSMDANGVLSHVCSGKMVCPENGGTHNGAKIVVSSSCTVEDSKYERIAGENSLKHVKSGRCIHANGGWPKLDLGLLIWSGCTGNRLAIWFMKPDCAVPLGMQNGQIKDSQITASSYRPNDEPQYGRINNKKFWCAKEKNKDEYLQVDLGEVKTVSTILVQGRNGWYDWITGFYFYYSLDGQRWTGYTESGDKEHSNSICYLGKCSEIHETQCKDVWGANAKNGDLECYNELNRNLDKYGSGTCNPVKSVACEASNVLCGQVQCDNPSEKPVVDFGSQYKKIDLGGKQCSGATLKSSDNLGLGMVRDGTKCGEDKMCFNQECKSLKELNFDKCKHSDDLECGGRGTCTDKATCRCENGYNPDDGCKTVLVPRAGGWGTWGSWSVCDKGCNGGQRNRFRFCDSPFPLHEGADCAGDREESESCNTQSCPDVISCHHLQQIGERENHYYPDGVYEINPTGSQPIKAYCDMSRDGGGWTLLVTSHTNSWTAQNVNLRNADSPNLKDDHSILQHADSIKDNINVDGAKFEYRLEAQARGRWGGIWEAPRGYTFLATDNKQRSVTLIKRFDDWKYSNNGIEQRMPWRDGARLTTSGDARSNWWGSITGDDKEYHPAPWINGHLQERQPSHIWYWLREGPYDPPRSCMEVQFRGFQLTNPIQDGVFIIQPPGKKEVKTFCDFSTEGGAWTLLLTSKTHSGWSQENVKERNVDSPSLDNDFSILGVADAIKDFDESQEYFQYRIEADGASRWGGIWDAPRFYTFLQSCDKQTNVKLVKKFDSWDENTNLGQRMPRLGLTKKLLLSSASSVDDATGSLVYNTGAGSASYLKNENPNPGVVRYWMREGARLSCNDLKLHGVRAGNVYDTDGVAMIRRSGAQYLPVYCDMTTSEGAFTLVVTSAHNSWTRAQVPRRNEFFPALNKDYSILDIADSIKSRSNNGTFQYMLDANQRRHWGGIFEAPTSYSFMAKDNTQKGVELTRKFGDWEFSWQNSLEKRMPWFDSATTHSRALLTTSTHADFAPSGSIIWAGSDKQPAQWMTGMYNPGVIWYWVNEDDCDVDRKAVDGALTEWGEWERCDKLCETGKQKRYKTCSNPKPRCGGKQCDPKAVTMEERDCTYCPESRILAYGDYCVAPNNGGCSPPDGAYLIFTKRGSPGCNDDDMMYVFDWQGVIHHKCSKKVICPQDNNPTYSKKLMLKDKCDLNIAVHKRLPGNNGLKNMKNKFCVHPNGGSQKEGVDLVYWNSCQSKKLKLEFVDLDPPVK